MDLEEYREKSRDSWERFSTGWDERRDYFSEKTARVTEALIAGLDPQPGQTALEVAGGTGDLTFAVAERIGEDGRVIFTDFASGMVDAARRRGEELGIANVDYRVLDAERMDLGDSSVDGVFCRFGYMLMADPAAALAETRRVLREGGHLAFGVWGSPEQNQWAFLPGLVMVELGHMPPPEPGAPGIFAMADPERIRALVTGAGFSEPSIEQVGVEWEFADADDHWDRFTMKLAAPIADAVAAAAPDDQERIRSTVRERVEQRLADDPHGMDGVVHVVVAR